MSSESQISHQDMLGRDLAVDQVVAFSHHNHLYLGRVVKLNPKMIRIKMLNQRSNRSLTKYPHDVVQLAESDVSWYLLKNG